jgi:hypothetical protein
MRSAGGLLFAAGAVVLLARKSGEWSAFARVLTVSVPAVVLYGLAVGRPGPTREETQRPWRSVLVVTAILLIPVALFEFLDWVGASTRHLLYPAAVFLITALLAGYAARRTRASYSALLAGLSLLVAWLLVWEEIFGHPSANTFRWLLVAAAALLLAAATALGRAGAIGASDVATAGGLAAVAAGVLGVVVGLFVAAARSFIGLIGPESGSISTGRHGSAASSNLLAIHTNGLQHFGWDLYLLIVSLAFAWLGSRVRVRGLAYVGGFGLLAFLISISAQITRLEAGRGPSGDIGWPLALLIIGVVGLAAPALYRRET